MRREMPHPTWAMIERLENENTRMKWALEKIAEQDQACCSSEQALGCPQVAHKALKDVAISHIHYVSE